MMSWPVLVYSYFTADTDGLPLHGHWPPHSSGINLMLWTAISHNRQVLPFHQANDSLAVCSPKGVSDRFRAAMVCGLTHYQ